MGQLLTNRNLNFSWSKSDTGAYIYDKKYSDPHKPNAYLFKYKEHLIDS
jgi:hypothetical protein